MLASSLIVKKREGGTLSDEDIEFLIRGFCSGEVPDYQMSALAMAICIRGMNARETATLTRAMLGSGESLPRPEAGSSREGRPRVDKHSTGGLGDKVSLILAPLLAVCDVDVPMISGRGLGLTGGTLDKLESIPGFRTEFSHQEAARLLDQNGAFIISANERIVPADRQLYALRDVTGTVESIPLTPASILSKKLAASLDSLIMDVKCGSGAFMKTEKDALTLAQSLVEVGTQAGLPTSALVTDMDQPLGVCIGNAVEVRESIEVLQGQPGEVRDLTIALCAELLVRCGAQQDLAAATERLEREMDSGRAMERFERMVNAQGGDLKPPLSIASPTVLTAEQPGYIESIDSISIGEVVVSMGGGRRTKSDQIDHSVGVEIHVRVGDQVDRGQEILTLRAPKGAVTDYASRIGAAVKISEDPVGSRALILHSVGSTS